MKITAFGGVGEVGGNKFLLEADKTKIFLDFGESFTRFDEYYSGLDFVEPRDTLGLKDYFEMGLIPQIPGLYAKEDLKHTDLKYTARKFDGVLISHMHGDHFSDACWLDPEIPIYIGHGAHALNDIYSQCYKMGTIDLTGKSVATFKSGEKFKTGNLQVTPIHVDHSTPGAYGFIIETSEGNIAYSGDFRFHGFRPQMTEEFMRAAAKAKVKYFMCEGTRMKAGAETFDVKRQSIYKTEPEVEAGMCDNFKKSPGISVVAFSPRNIDRTRSLYNAAVCAKKKVVISPRMAFVLEQAAPYIKDIPLPANNPNIIIYKMDGDKPDEYNKGDGQLKVPMIYERPYLSDKKYNKADYKSLKGKHSDIVMFLQETDIDQLIDIKPKNGIYVYAASEHYLFGDEFEVKKDCLDNWLKHFNLEFRLIHCSGHADEPGIKRMIEGVGAGTVIPMHTQFPEEFKKYAKNVKLLEKEKTVQL